VIGIPRPDNYFDYVRQRFLTGAIPTDKWKDHSQECIHVCEPGGWVEIVETFGQFFEGGPAFQQFNTWIAEALKKRGIDVYLAHQLDEVMREAGLTNVAKEAFIAPVGAWGGKPGELFYEDLKLFRQAVQPLITGVHGVPKEEVEKVADALLEECNSHQVHLKIFAYLGQKQ
jgi:hypothetical protein